MLSFFSKMLIKALAMLLRNVPDFHGRHRIYSKVLRHLRQFGSRYGTAIIRTRHGFYFNADINDWLGQYVYINGVYEPPTTKLFVDIIKRGDIVLDVGANVGFFSLLSSSLVGEHGKVYAFEPIPSVRDKLIANIKINKFNNIEVIPKAASDQAGATKIYEGPEGHKGISSLRPLDSASQCITIETVPLDNMADVFGRVGLIKIDVEGAELLALKGMSKIISRDHPNLIIEFTDSYLKSFGHSTRQMADWLTQKGYQLYRIDDAGVTPLALSSDSIPDQYNVLATPKR